MSPFLERHADKWVPEPNTGCFIWMGGRSGNQMAATLSVWKGRQIRVARRVCEEVYGPPPTSQHQTAHATPNGCIGQLCVNWAHLRWATPLENARDIPFEKLSSRPQTQANFRPPSLRAKARSEGLKFYDTSKPCVNGHYSVRRVRNKGCLACEKMARTDRLASI